MRLLEWLFFLSFIPSLLLPYWWRHRLSHLTGVALPVVAAVCQVVLEGWRVQMVPLYLIALFRLVFYGLKRNKNPRIITSSIMAVIVAACTLLPGWLLPVTILPTPTGSYLVGVLDREVVDESRDRRLMVSVWYPAAQPGEQHSEPAPLFQYPDAVAKGLTSSLGFPSAAPLLQHLRYTKVSASDEAPLLANDTPLPVLIFSHGLVGIRAQNTSTFQELASHGYVVVALDHTDAAAVTVFPDGETRLFSLERFGITDVERSTELLLPYWVADQRFIYATLEQWSKTDRFFAGKLDLKRMASFGHSFGGATAIEVCKLESRCLAAVNLDGGLVDTILTQPVTRPLLLMTSSDSNRLSYATEKWSRLIKEATGPKYWLELLGSNHYSFTIMPLISPLIAPRGFNVRAALGIMDKYLLAFFDFYLRGIQTTLLTSTSNDPAVRWHSQ